jgi:predicted permease
MARRPGLTLLVVSTLAVGIAANAAIFSAVDALLLRSYPFPNLEHLVRLWETAPSADPYERDNVATGNFRDWEAQSKPTLEGMVALEWWDANLRGREVAERVQGYRVSPGFFDTLGVPLALGRGFRPEEEEPGMDRRVVLGHALWKRQFGGDPGVVGSSVRVDGEPHVVVGVAPDGFVFPYGSEIWAPLPVPRTGGARDDHGLAVIARLAPGRSASDAGGLMSLVGKRLEAEHPSTNASRGIALGPLQRSYEDPLLRPLMALWQVAALVVLLIACVNVANLILAQGAERRRELAVRVALGAGRGHVVRQLLTEGLVTALLSVLASVPLSSLAARGLRENMPPEIERFLPGWGSIKIDVPTLAFSLGLGILATFVFTLLPALKASQHGLAEALKEGGRSATTGSARQRGRSFLVVAQIAGALTLVVVAGLVVKSAKDLLLGPQGYDPDHLLTLRLSLPGSSYGTPEARRAFARSALEHLARIPGVDSVAFSNLLPGQTANTSDRIQAEDEPPFDKSNPPVADDRAVSLSFFETLKVPILAGRGIQASDDERAAPVAVVSRSLAARHWPGRDPLGRRFRLGDETSPWITVVGVAGDVVHHWEGRRGYPTSYRPYAQRPTQSLGFALRTRGEPEAVAQAARRAIADVDPYQPAYAVFSMRRSISISGVGLQYVAGTMAAFGGLSLVLAISGVYGVMSYRISLRTQEIGVRVALGASQASVIRLAMAQALRLTSAGLLMGGALGFGAARSLSAMLEGTVAFDLNTFATAIALMGGTAILAAYLPVRRALGVDPVEALRSE